MRRTVRISDNIVSPLGFSSEANYAAVKAGRSEIRRHEGTFGVPQPFAASLFDRDVVMAKAAECGIPAGLSLFDTICLLSATLALEGSGVDTRSPKTAFILSTTKGNVELIGEEDVDQTRALLGFSARLIGEFFGNPNPVEVVSNACISGVCAIIQASRMIADGSYDHVVVVGAEVQSRFIISGFLCLKALSDSLCRPFDASRCGLNAGEAAATMVLAASDKVEDSQWEVVRGAIRNDANHISGPSRTGEGSYNALRYVLEASRKDELAFVNVHGTATVYNDEMESIALDRAGLSDMPVNALKGIYGHTMGAAGVLESIISIHACEDGTVLGTRGYSERGTSRPVNVSAENRTTDRTAFVKLLSGFGGCNAAVLFRKGDGPGGEIPAEPELETKKTVRLSSEDCDLVALYREQVGDYPKFFKMDTLCKLGFLATELLLKGEDRTELREDRAVLLFNTSGSVCNDRHFQETVSDPEGWFPSPALFVYTLANIVTGELAIRNRFKGESSFHVLGKKDQAQMDRIIREAFMDGVTRTAVCGWVECSADDCFEAEISLISKKNS
ncbi:MAG: 3-oxoacyl-ACP synthase [Bacteroidales bacterium]|nr:3-oxoacyl-ACP synthase [Candidatus Cryptobacteroides caccocaballi]